MQLNRFEGSGAADAMSLPYLSKKAGLATEHAIASWPVKHVTLPFQSHKVAPACKTSRSLAEQSTPLNRGGLVCVALRDERGSNAS
ncbi:hypothetical protein [Acidovorax sp.]|uniref:hypothetical protein n=1 Tax=Acidovorax sp. TaxID=1872122 RepID=UPI002ACDB10E|nr:hypothetical protein [Acidovorax sp.]MDZ7862939.1 hypothetical protein [Acidovorax sp.]